MSGYGTLPAHSAIRPLRTKWPLAYVPYDIPVPPCTAAIVGLELSISPSGSGEMWPSFLSLSEDGQTITCWMADGIAGRKYLVQVRAALADRSSPQWVYSVLCAPELALYPLPPFQNPGFGCPVTWSQGQYMFGPVLNLPPATIQATGTTQLTAAIAPLAKVLVNAATAAGAGAVLPAAASFCGNTMPVYNRSGVAIMVYPYSGDQIEGLGANVGTELENEQTANFSVSQSGALILS